MTAIIVQIQNNHAAALLEDGRFVRVPNRRYRLGQRVAMNRTAPMTRKLSAIAAALMLCIGLTGFAGHLFFSPYAYLSIDVNPSLELTLNRFNRVLAVEAVNEDGAEIAGELDLKRVRYAPVGQAVEETVSRLMASEYVQPEDENYVVIAASTAGGTRGEPLLQAASQAARSAAEKQQVTLTVVEVQADTARREEAKAQGTTPGKLAVVEQLMAGAETEAAQEDAHYWMERPVREIMREMADRDAARTQESTPPTGMPVNGTIAPQTSPAPRTSEAPVPEGKAATEGKATTESKAVSGGGQQQPQVTEAPTPARKETPTTGTTTETPKTQQTPAEQSGGPAATQSAQPPAQPEGEPPKQQEAPAQPGAAQNPQGQPQGGGQ